ncbi:MAG: IS66 family insertion sequence element accessory protein TnpA [Planctomycetota bacterium]|jgi:hypothetical protein
MTVRAKRQPRAEKRAYWTRVFDEWQASGLDEVEYCRRRTISITKFRWWRKRVRPPNPEPPSFVSVKISGGAQAPGITAEIEVVFPRGLFLRVRPGFDAETLARVIDILEAPPCG